MSWTHRKAGHFMLSNLNVPVASEQTQILFVLSLISTLESCQTKMPEADGDHGFFKASAQ